MVNTKTDENEFVPVDDDTAVIFRNGSITDSATLGDFNTPAAENMDYGAASSLWKKASDHFYNLGNPDKFFADRSVRSVLIPADYSRMAGGGAFTGGNDRLSCDWPGRSLQ